MVEQDSQPQVSHERDSVMIDRNLSQKFPESTIRVRFLVTKCELRSLSMNAIICESEVL